jgi:molybdopterin molybdotransferase
MIRFDQAIALINAEVRRLPAETVALDAALGRVTASELDSPAALPPFDNSAMDGFALASDGAVLSAGREFEVGGESAAGDPDQHATGGAFEIMTGAVLPRGLDSVVPVEQVEPIELDGNGRPRRIRLNADVAPGAHVRRRGEDILPGAQVLPAAARIGAEALMLLAALGIGQLPVVRRPRAALVCTGRELVDDPAQPLGEGQIRNSNGPYLGARLRQAGAEVVLQGRSGDDVDAFLSVLAPALEAGCDLVLSTGAVSMGRYDFVPAALQRLGARVVFHKVAMRPGKPLLFAVLPGGTLFFGLPGNPVSSAVGMRFYVEAALRAMTGLPPERPQRVPLAEPLRKKAGFRMFQKAELRFDGEGRAAVTRLAGQESFRIVPLVQANAWLTLPEDAEEMAAGELVDVYGLTG